MGYADALKHDERRRARRREINRVTKIRLTNDTLLRECLVTDISTGGVRLHVEGFDVPEDFVLCFLGRRSRQGMQLSGGLAGRP